MYELFTLGHYHAGLENVAFILLGIFSLFLHLITLLSYPSLSPPRYFAAGKFAHLAIRVPDSGILDEL